MPTQYSVKIHLSPDALSLLQDGKYRICLVKNFEVDSHEHNGNVVFLSMPSEGLGPDVVFTWTERYRVSANVSFSVSQCLLL
jgi:hypothetical protein